MKTPFENFSLLHVGINCASEEEARQQTNLYCSMLGKECIELEQSYFVGTVIEVMKKPFLGAHGHMAYGVWDMQEALDLLAKKGFYPDMDTAVYDDQEQLIVVYLAGEFGGFAVHLKLLTDA